jgi:hypothetical protein
LNIYGNTDLTLKYGSFDAESIDDRFEKISLDAAYCDITMDLIPLYPTRFEIRHLNAFVVIPDNNIKSEKEVINKDKRIPDYRHVWKQSWFKGSRN